MDIFHYIKIKHFTWLKKKQSQKTNNRLGKIFANHDRQRVNICNTQKATANHKILTGKSGPKSTEISQKKSDMPNKYMKRYLTLMVVRTTEIKAMRCHFNRMARQFLKL